MVDMRERLSYLPDDEKVNRRLAVYHRRRQWMAGYPELIQSKRWDIIVCRIVASLAVYAISVPLLSGMEYDITLDLLDVGLSAEWSVALAILLVNALMFVSAKDTR